MNKAGLCVNTLSVACAIHKIRSFYLLRKESGMEKRYININDLSDYLGIPKGTIYVWVCLKKIPYVKTGRLLRFDLRKIDLWAQENSVEVI